MTGPALSILARCRRLGIVLQADGQRLRYKPFEAVDDDLRADLVRFKGELLATLAAGAVADLVDCGDVKERDERPAVGAGVSDEHVGLQQGDGVRVTDDVGLAPGREDTKRIEGVTVEQFADGVSGAHTQSIAADAPDGQALAIAYRLPEAWDKADKAVIEALRGERVIFTATAASGEPVDGMPDRLEKHLDGIPNK